MPQTGHLVATDSLSVVAYKVESGASIIRSSFVIGFRVDSSAVKENTIYKLSSGSALLHERRRNEAYDL